MRLQNMPRAQKESLIELAVNTEEVRLAMRYEKKLAS